MSLKKILLFALSVIVICGGFALPCDAQNPFKRRTTLRWLGQGFSDGYHRHNPGHDTSYYNPYTAHNSFLYSQTPEYQAILARQAGQQPSQRFFAGVPYSVYAAPNHLTSGIQALPGLQVEGSFSPSAETGVSDSDQESDNAFSRSDENDDNDFRENDSFDDDNDFREEDFDSMEDKDLMEDMDSDKVKRGMPDAEDADVDTSDIGSLSGLNESLSFDFE